MNCRILFWFHFRGVKILCVLSSMLQQHPKMFGQSYYFRILIAITLTLVPLLKFQHELSRTDWVYWNFLLIKRIYWISTLSKSLMIDILHGINFRGLASYIHAMQFLISLMKSSHFGLFYGFLSSVITRVTFIITPLSYSNIYWRRKNYQTKKKRLRTQ